MKRAVETWAWLPIVAGILLIISVIAGCGGGTDGSGIRRISGNLSTAESAAPLPDVSVVELESGNSTTTDQSGDFELEGSAESSSSTLLFEGAGISAAVELADLPTESSSVSARFEADTQENRVTAKDVTVVRNPPTAAPTQAPPPPVEPTATPLPPAGPTQTPTPGGQQTPVASPTPQATSAPTFTPTVTPTPGPLPEACRYDLNGNGIVDTADINVASDLFAQGQLGDINGDGVANSSDLSAFITYVLANLGATCP